MLNLIKTTIKEPLLHFLLLGALAYLYFDYYQESPATQKETVITIENYELKALQKATKLQDPELVLELLKYQKILLAEAYSLELYKEDKQISKLLLEKAAYLINTDKKFEEPTEEQLKEFYNSHLNDYSHLQSFDLYTISLGSKTDRKIIQKLSKVSDLISIAKSYKNYTPKLLEEKFGKYTAFKLSHLAQGFWSEPIQNGSDENIYFISNKKAEKPYPFEEVEDIVYENYKKEFFTKNAQQEYAKLYNKYIIKEQK
ncbi:peptidylprolyl isomerase [Sulfurimonas sp. C5]|uniref:peptidylprolyl isomerase n=1 Tax=Sulfurimonas sp. C5 TaxID=3036947 RepID=UPI00245583D9|nr:peptidylprolyl isomerase [Sulfurimonas sp. C5]MDH4944744.1 peptidylprolyl isomerase [Sulfurimonas sp. C5]